MIFGVSYWECLTQKPSLLGLLKKAASGVLAIFPLTYYAHIPRVKAAAALLDGLF